MAGFYCCIKDKQNTGPLESDGFAVGSLGNAEYWRGRALEWAVGDNAPESTIDLLKNSNENELMKFIADNWDLVIEPSDYATPGGFYKLPFRVEDYDKDTLLRVMEHTQKAQIAEFFYNTKDDFPNSVVLKSLIKENPQRAWDLACITFDKCVDNPDLSFKDNVDLAVERFELAQKFELNHGNKFIPYDKKYLIENSNTLHLINSDMKDKYVRCALVKAGYGLDKFYKDEDEEVRVEVARRGNYLDELRKDISPRVRAEVALRGRKEDLEILINDKDKDVLCAVALSGYGLDKLAEMNNPEINRHIEKYLSDKQYFYEHGYEEDKDKAFSDALDLWEKSNPEKCVLEENSLEDLDNKEKFEVRQKEIEANTLEDLPDSDIVYDEAGVAVGGIDLKQERSGGRAKPTRRNVGESGFHTTKQDRQEADPLTEERNEIAAKIPNSHENPDYVHAQDKAAR